MAKNNSNQKQRISVHVTCLIDQNLKRQVQSLSATATPNETTELEIDSTGMVAGVGYALDPPTIVLHFSCLTAKPIKQK